MKWVAVAPFELKLGPNESYGRAASVKPPPGATKAQIRANMIVKLPILRPGGRYVKEKPLPTVLHDGVHDVKSQGNAQRASHNAKGLTSLPNGVPTHGSPRFHNS